MKRSYPDDLVIGNLSRRGFLKGVGATGVLLVAANWGWRDALAAAGEAGVRNLLELIEKEMRVAMVLTGAKSIGEISADSLVRELGA